ncbi:Guanine nucleotide binding protein (G protein), beta polypeptide 1-like [Chytriomyces hyalinus]|nr:Guanine nucleotide binding protein (G protein), beta polypeptide 1-like [Chytriomyces hyalinus]
MEHAVRIGSAVTSVCLLRIKEEALAAVGTEDGFIVIVSLKSLRALFRIAVNGDKSGFSTGINSIEFHSPHLYCQSRAFVLAVFDLEQCLVDHRNGQTVFAPVSTLPINSLNFCRVHIAPLMSLVQASAALDTPASMEVGDAMLMATTGVSQDSDQLDIIDLKSKRFYIKGLTPTTSDGEVVVPAKTGMIMCVKMFPIPESMRSGDLNEFCVNIGYESGDVICYRIFEAKHVEQNTFDQAKASVLWSVKAFSQPVTCLDVCPKSKYAVAGAADESLIRVAIDQQSSSKLKSVTLPAGCKGASSIQIRDDGRIMAVACWDSTIRIFSAKTMAPLGILGADVHRRGIGCISFVTRTTIHAGLKSVEDSLIAQNLKDNPILVLNSTSNRGSTAVVGSLKKIDGYGMRENVMPDNMMAVGTEDGRLVLWTIY